MYSLLTTLGVADKREAGNRSKNHETGIGAEEDQLISDSSESTLDL